MQKENNAQAKGRGMMGMMRRHPATVVWVAALVVTAVVLLVYERHVLWKIQEQSLWLDTPAFFKEMMVVPGGLLMYVGSFLTQLLYWPWLGVAVMCAWWFGLMWLMRRTFRVGEPWAALLLVPVALLLVANTDMGYWIYPIKLRGWYFDATVGVTATVALLWAYRSVSGWRPWRRVLLVVAAALGYPLLGCYALAAVVLMALWCWRLDGDRWQSVVDSVLALLMVAAVPLLCYQYVYYQTNMVNLWWVALPTFRILENYPVYYVPYALLGVCLVVLTMSDGRRKTADGGGKTADGGGKTADGKHHTSAIIHLTSTAVVLLLTVYGVWYGWMKDENFHREVAMEHFVEQTRWEDVLEEAAKQQDVPTRAVVVMRNLALSRLGRQSTEMYRYVNGSKQPASPFPLQMSMIVGDLMYYHYGMLNDCHHMCIEGGVEFGWRSQHLKYMARCGLMGNEVSVMYKYTGLLKHTLFHGSWAEHLESLQQQPAKKAEDKETGPVTHMLQYPDMVGTDHGYAEKYIMNHLAALDSSDPYFQEQCLLATLWTKNSDQFWHRFAKYLGRHHGEDIPRYYQEAAYLYIMTQEAAPINVPIDESIKRTYKEFTDLLPRYNGMDVKEVRKKLYPLYGDTYFFQYYMFDDLVYL
jgi:hypothetical protein